MPRSNCSREALSVFLAAQGLARPPSCSTSSRRWMQRPCAMPRSTSTPSRMRRPCRPFWSSHWRRSQVCPACMLLSKVLVSYAVGRTGASQSRTTCTGVRFGPPGAKRLVYFIDDMNMPFVDKYDTQSAIELLRQSLDYRGWFDKVRTPAPCQQTSVHSLTFACSAERDISGGTDQDRAQRGHKHPVLGVHEPDGRLFPHHAAYAAAFCHLCCADAFAGDSQAGPLLLLQCEYTCPPIT